MKIELESKILIGAESKQWLADLATILARLEALAKNAQGIADDAQSPAPVVAKKKAKAAQVEEEDETPASDDAPDADDSDEEELAPKPKAKKKAASSFDDEDEDETPAPKATKAKIATINDVNDACKARAKGGRRDEVLAILKKKFKTQTVSEIKPDQYGDVIKAMEE